MRLLVDQNLPRSFTHTLAQADHDVAHVGELGLGQASDPEVFAVCVDRGCVLITGDKKLTKFLAAAGATEPSVVVVRGFGGSMSEVAATVVANLELVSETIANRGRRPSRWHLTAPLVSSYCLS